MNNNYKKIFWGLILLIINFNLTFDRFNISIIPSFICFIIIYRGLKGLAEEEDSRYFYIGAILSKVMIVLTLFRWLVDTFTSIDSSYIIGNSNIIVIVISFFIEVVTLVIIYCIVKAIYLEYEKVSIGRIYEESRKCMEFLFYSITNYLCY